MAASLLLALLAHADRAAGQDALHVELEEEVYCDPAAEHAPALKSGWTAWFQGPWPTACEILPPVPLPPLGEPWNVRTHDAGLFVGSFDGDELIQGRVEMGHGVIAGLRLGWDFDDYWGCEGRAAWASADVVNIQTGLNTRNGDVQYFDASLLMYPFTKPRFRPFLAAGLGLAVFDFADDQGLNVTESSLAVPLAIGFKYRHTDWAALRFDITDNLALGDGGELATTHSISLSGGVEIRFGGRRRSYWPWDPSRSWW